MSTNPVVGNAKLLTRRITWLTKVAVLCAIAFCLFLFYRGVFISDSTPVFFNIAVLVFVLISCRLLEKLYKDRVKQER